jgi:hypothetical protein
MRRLSYFTGDLRGAARDANGIVPGVLTQLMFRVSF